jgi:hypothetical protein
VGRAAVGCADAGDVQASGVVVEEGQGVQALQADGVFSWARRGTSF